MKRLSLFRWIAGLGSAALFFGQSFVPDGGKMDLLIHARSLQCVVDILGCGTKPMLPIKMGIDLAFVGCFFAWVVLAAAGRDFVKVWSWLLVAVGMATAVVDLLENSYILAFARPEPLGCSETLARQIIDIQPLKFGMYGVTFLGVTAITLLRWRRRRRFDPTGPG